MSTFLRGGGGASHKEVTFTERKHPGGGMSYFVVVSGGYHCSGFLKNHLNLIFVTSKQVKEWKSRAPLTPPEIANLTTRLTEHCARNDIQLRRVGDRISSAAGGVAGAGSGGSSNGSSAGATSPGAAFGRATGPATRRYNGSCSSVEVLEKEVGGRTIMVVRRNASVIKNDLKSFGFWWGGTLPNKEWRSPGGLSTEARRQLVGRIMEACLRVTPVPVRCIVTGTLAAGATTTTTTTTSIGPGVPCLGGIMPGGRDGALSSGAAHGAPDTANVSSSGRGSSTLAYLAPAETAAKYYPASGGSSLQARPGSLAAGGVSSGGGGGGGGVVGRGETREMGWNLPTSSQQSSAAVRDPKLESVEASAGAISGMLTKPVPALSVRLASPPEGGAAAQGYGGSVLADAGGAGGVGGSDLIIVVEKCYDVRDSLRRDLGLVWVAEDQEYVSKPLGMDAAKAMAESVRCLCRNAEIPVPSMPVFPRPPSGNFGGGGGSNEGKENGSGSGSGNGNGGENGSLADHRIADDSPADDQGLSQPSSSHEKHANFSQESTLNEESALAQESTLSQQSFGDEECSPPDTPLQAPDENLPGVSHGARFPGSRPRSPDSFIAGSSKRRAAEHELSTASRHDAVDGRKRARTHRTEEFASLAVVSTSETQRGTDAVPLPSTPSRTAFEGTPSSASSKRVASGGDDANGDGSAAATSAAVDGKAMRERGGFGDGESGGSGPLRLSCREPPSWVSMGFAPGFAPPRFPPRPKVLSGGGQDEEKEGGEGGESSGRNAANGKGKANGEGMRWPSEFPVLEVAVGGDGFQARRAMRCLLAAEGEGGRKGGPLEGMFVWREERKAWCTTACGTQLWGARRNVTLDFLRASLETMSALVEDVECRDLTGGTDRAPTMRCRKHGLDLEEEIHGGGGLSSSRTRRSVAVCPVDRERCTFVPYDGFSNQEFCSGRREARVSLHRDNSGAGRSGGAEASVGKAGRVETIGKDACSSIAVRLNMGDAA